MARSMHGRRVKSDVVREALTKLLADQTEPVSTRDLVTAVYHLTGDDHIGNGNVAPVLRRMAAAGQARRTVDGLWVGVSS